MYNFLQYKECPVNYILNEKREQNILLFRIKRYITKLKGESNLKTYFLHVFIKISIVNWIKKIIKDIFELRTMYDTDYIINIVIWYLTSTQIKYHWIRIITKLTNSEQSYKGKVKIHKYINRQNQSTTGKLWKP